LFCRHSHKACEADSATLSPMLKRLEALGLITRSRGTTDERTTQVKSLDVPN
jgi:DNA-binding MarR family transcriptional regulator